MTAQLAISERKVKRLTRERDAAREEAEALKQKLAQARKKLRLVARTTATPAPGRKSDPAILELARARAEQQAAADVLRIVSKSLTDTKPVFDAILESARTLFAESAGGSVWLKAGDQLEAVAGMAPSGLPVGQLPPPLPLTRDYLNSLAVLDGRVIRIDNVNDDRELPEPARKRLSGYGVQSVISAPLLSREGAIGSITLHGTKPGVFSDKHVALLQTFADQAVIAIENARLFNELEASNREQAETLQYQKATADVLKIVSRSQSDTTPVFEAIVASAVELFDMPLCSVWLRNGDQMEAAASAVSPKPAPVPLEPTYINSLAVLEARSIKIDDVSVSEELPEPARLRLIERGVRSTMVAPNAQRRQGHWQHYLRYCGTEKNQRQTGRAAADLRRPGGDRHRERAAVQRTSGNHPSPKGHR